MSDDPRPILDPGSDAIDALTARYEAMDKAALARLAAQLTTTYVVEGLGSLTLGDAPSLAKGRDEVGEETFAGLLKRLKRERPDDPILERFIVNGEHIQVKTSTGNINLTEYKRAAAPPAPAVAQSGPAPAVPTSRDSIYNRELYGQPAAASNRSNPQPAPSGAPAQGARTNAPAPQPGANPAPRGPQPATPPGQPGQKQPENKDEKKSDRIRMIELD